MHGLLTEEIFCLLGLLQHSILFFLQVNHKEEDSCSYFYCMEERHASAEHVAYAVSSLSKSYIYLDTETSSILPCNQIHTVQAHFILKWDFGVLKELVFYYLVSTGSKLKQQTNKQQTNNNKTKQNQRILFSLDHVSPYTLGSRLGNLPEIQ